MKKTTVMAAALLSSATAMASLKITVRSDYVNGGEYTNTSNTKVGSTSLLLPKIAEMDFGAKVGDADVKGRLNLREYTAVVGSSSATAVMTPDQFVGFLYAEKALGDFVFSAGKIETNSGGFESARGDSYLTSLANGGVNNNHGSSIAEGTAVTSPGNASGVGIAYVVGAHKVTFQVENSTNSSSASVVSGNVIPSTKKRHNLGVNYKGSFLDKMIAVNAGYISGKTDTIGSDNVDETYMNLSTALNFGDLLVEADYIANSKLSAATGAKADKTTSIVAEGRYKMGTIAPVLKIESSEHKASDDAAATGSFKRTGYALGVELTPKADENFRYHVAYAGVSDTYGKAGLANDKVSYGQIVVGFKYVGDILK